MRKIFLGVLIGVAIFGLVGITTAAIAIPAADKATEKAEAEQSPVISGDWELNPPGLEKIEFIHWKKNFAKPEPAKSPKPPSCYKFLTGSKVRWSALPVNYVINPISPLPEKLLLTEGQIENAIYNGAETWDAAATSKELMNDNYMVDYAAVYGVRDQKNVIAFGNYPTNGVIAVTTVWYNTVTKSIVEFDIEFDTDWTWGDLGNTETPPDPTSTVMDLQNIAIHELGHSVGLADVYDSACWTVTMYGYSNYGETQKRTLEQPDIKGLQTLYGI